MCEVVNKNKSQYDIFIGRPSKWGNPFELGIDGDRKEVIQKYKEYLQDNIELLNSLEELKGKRLGCFCKPLDCHGDVLKEFLEFKNNFFLENKEIFIFDFKYLISFDNPIENLKNIIYKLNNSNKNFDGIIFIDNSKEIEKNQERNKILLEFKKMLNENNFLILKLKYSTHSIIECLKKQLSNNKIIFFNDNYKESLNFRVFDLKINKYINNIKDEIIEEKYEEIPFIYIEENKLLNNKLNKKIKYKII